MTPGLTPAAQDWHAMLCQLAWQAVEAAACQTPMPPLPAPLPKPLAEPGACFVTLTRHGDLRGCIGSLEPCRSLAEDLLANARSAALRDPRFPALHRAELDGLEVSISVLGPRQPLTRGGRSDILAQLTPGEDGLVISHANSRATFLPSVWEQLPDPDAFFQQLRLKAGIAETIPDQELTCQRYQVLHLHCGTRKHNHR